MKERDGNSDEFVFIGSITGPHRGYKTTRKHQKSVLQPNIALLIGHFTPSEQEITRRRIFKV